MMRLPRLLGAGLLLMATASIFVSVAQRPARTFTGTIPAGPGPDAVAVDARTGHTFIANSIGDTITMLATGSGRVLRTVGVGRGPRAVVVDELAGRAFVLNDTDESVSVLDAATGTVLHTIGFPGVYHRLIDLAVDDETGHVFVLDAPADSCGGFHPTRVYMLAVSTGAVLGSSRVGSDPRHLALDPRTRRAFVTNTKDGTVSVLDTLTGQVVGTSRVGTGPTVVAIDARTRRAFVANSVDDTVSVLDARTGSVLRAVAIGGAPQAIAAAPGDGRIFVLSGDDGAISMLDARTGAVLHTVAGNALLPSPAGGANPVTLLADGGGERVFVLMGSGRDRDFDLTGGSVSVLDARNGRVLARLPVGQTPVALAMDERTGHLFVVNADGGRPPATGITANGVWNLLPRGLRRRLPWRPPPQPSVRAGSITILDTSGV